MKSYIKKIILGFILSLFYLCQTTAQLTITNYSNKSHVYAINITHDTVWTGTDGGIIISDLFGNIYGTLTVNDSLGSNYITSIAVDSAGNKWFGTYDNGLIKFNKGHCQYFNTANTPNLANKINCLEADNNGSVWIGTDNGAARYNGNIFSFFTTSSNVQGIVKTICIDGPNVWFGTANNGLYRYNGSWSRITSGVPNAINDLTANNDTLFIASSNGIGYYIKEISNPRFEQYAAITGCISIEKSSSGVLWVGTTNLLYYGNYHSFFPFTGFAMSSYPLLKSARNGYMWAGFGKEGKFAKFTNGLSSYPLSLSEMSPQTNETTCILQHNGIKYFGTHNNGIIRNQSVTWDQFFYTEPEVFALAAKNDSIFAGTQTGYYILYSGTETPISTSSPVKAIEVDKKGVVWFGTDNGIFNLKNNVQSSLSTSGLLNAKVLAIVADSLNQKWFLHSDGLTKYDGTTYTKIPISNMGSATAELFDLAVDTLGTLWIASSMGVIHYDGNSFVHFQQIDGLPENKILSVFVDSRNIKYFGTANSGLSLYNGSVFRNIGKNQYRLATNKITSIYGEKYTNDIWLSGEYGGISQLMISPINVQIIPQGSSPICPGQSLTLQAYVMGGLFYDQMNYSWTASDGTISSRALSITVIPKAPTTYYLQAGDGILRSGNQFLVNLFPFTPYPINGPDHVCSNNLFSSYSVQNDNNRTYNWTIQGGFPSTASGTDISVSWDSLSPFRQLTLLEYGLNNGCSVKHDLPVSLEHMPVPKLIRKGQNLIICTDSGMMNYQWYLNESLLQEAPNRQFYYMYKTSASASGNYSVGITSYYGCYALSGLIKVINKNIDLYPNPAKNHVNIEFYNDEVSGKDIEIRDINGILVKSINIPPGDGIQKSTFDVSSYKPGTYFYQIKEGSQIFSSGKFIKD